MILELRQRLAELGGALRREACHQHVAPGGDHVPGDRDDLLRRLALAQDHLGEPVPQRAVMIDLRKAEVFEGHAAQPVKRDVDRTCSALDLGEQVGEPSSFHLSAGSFGARARATPAQRAGSRV